MCVYSTQQEEGCVCGLGEHEHYEEELNFDTTHEMRYEDEDELLTDEDDGNWDNVPYINDIEPTQHNYPKGGD